MLKDNNGIDAVGNTVAGWNLLKDSDYSISS